MADLDRNTQTSKPMRITNEAENRTAGIIDDRLKVDANISSVNVPLGKDPFPDTYFYITNAGAIGDTITIDIAPTNNDTSSPDADFPAYQFIYTLVAIDVGNEKQLSISLADALNADINFQDGQKLEAEAVIDEADNKRAVVHITSTEYSLNGEFYERPNLDDFLVTASGTTTVDLADAQRNIVSRPKEVSLQRDPNNPHRLGIQNISGEIFIRSTDPDSIVRERILDQATQTSFDLNVNGAVTPVVFEKVANADGESDILVDSLKLFGNDGNIKVTVSNFLGLNSALTNGVLIELIRDGIPIFSEEIFNTVELLALWSTTASDNKIIGASAGDYFESTFSLIDKSLAFVLRNGENDLIRVTIRDDLRQVDAFYLLIDAREDD